MRALIFALLAVSCYDPALHGGQLRCAPSGKQCPDGYFCCAADDRCWMTSQVSACGLPDAAFSVDAAPPDIASAPDLAMTPDSAIAPDLAVSCPPCYASKNGACVPVPDNTLCSDFQCLQNGSLIPVEGICSAGVCSAKDPMCGAYLCFVDPTGSYACETKCVCGSSPACATAHSCTCAAGAMYGVCQ